MRRAKVRINTKIEIKALLGHGISQRHVAKRFEKMCLKCVKEAQEQSASFKYTGSRS